MSLSLSLPFFLSSFLPFYLSLCLLSLSVSLSVQCMCVIWSWKTETHINTYTIQIIQASDQPLSIIIVGVGEGNFDLMEDLDSDNQLLTTDGRMASRDIVQVCSFWINKWFPRMHFSSFRSATSSMAAPTVEKCKSCSRVWFERSWRVKCLLKFPTRLEVSNSLYIGNRYPNFCRFLDILPTERTLSNARNQILIF